MSRLGTAFLFSIVMVGQALAQDYPTRVVRVLVGYPPGGGMDTIARVPTPSSPAELAAQIAEETKRWAAVVKAAGIKVD